MKEPKSRKKAARPLTITFVPTEQVVGMLETRMKPYVRHGHRARGIQTFFLNSCLEFALANKDFDPKT